MRWMLALALLLAGCTGLVGPADDVGPNDRTLDAEGPFLLDCRTAPLPCLRLATPEGGPANEVDLAMNPEDPLHLVGGAKDYGLGEATECGEHRVWSGVYVSRDGGDTWTNGYLPGHPDDPEGALNGFPCISDPVIQFSPDGSKVYYSGLAYGGEALEPGAPSTDEGTASQKGSAIFVAISEDGGETWPEVRFVATSDGERVFHDKQWFTVGPDGALQMTWTSFTILPEELAVLPGAEDLLFSGQVLHSRSTDEAITWSDPVPLYEFEAQGTDVRGPSTSKQFSTPVSVLEGTIAVTWMVYEDDGTGTVVMTQSSDNGESFGQAKPIFTVQPIPGQLEPSEFRTSTYPVAAADPGTGTMVIAYSEWNGNDADVVLRYSYDAGSSWSQPIQVPTETTNDQFMPWVALDENGGAHVTWFDRRNDPDNRLIDAYYAYSPDASRFIHEERLTPEPFDGDLGIHQSGEPFIGDYINIAARNGHAYPFFPATFDGTSQVYVAPLEYELDL